MMDMDITTAWYALAAILVVVGLLGTVLPALPGLPLMFAGMLLAAWVEDFQHIGGMTLSILGILMLLSIGVDFLATALGANRVGASRLAVVGAAVGTFAGLLAGIPGLVIGPFAGAVAGELLHQRSLAREHLGGAAKVGLGTWVGLAIGTALKLGIAFAMLGIFGLAVWL